MQPQLRDIVDAIRPDGTREFVRGVFEDLGRLLGYLDGLRPLIADGGEDEAHFIFEVVRCEALAAAGGLDYFCACLDAPDELSEELERTSFAVRHELRAVFERILPSAREAADAEEVRSRLADAHDLLRNCFEQSTVSLARAFRPGVDAAELFEGIRAKRENSLRLYEDLEALLRSVRYAEWHDGAEPLVNFSERLEHFRAESMCHLMQKDRETCRGFIDGLAAVRDRRGFRLYLHRFSCYLEILLKHVGQRSVLSDLTLRAAA
ncbi:MAG: hypothetical protein LC795_07370 [Acidobacteria bacterium]|nr:hypothetical protein [Acidobacteriota bacterium]